MTERTFTTSFSRAGDEPWPSIEARWPNATWMSPWAFDDDGDHGNDLDRAEDPDAPSSH